MGYRKPIRMACLQIEPCVGDLSGNVDKTCGYLEKAHAEGAKIVVLPELCNSGYVFESREEAFSLAVHVPEAPTTKPRVVAASDYDMFIVAGLAEQEDGRLYNSALAVCPDGHTGTYRQTRLWATDNQFTLHVSNLNPASAISGAPRGDNVSRAVMPVRSATACRSPRLSDQPV